MTQVFKGYGKLVWSNPKMFAWIYEGRKYWNIWLGNPYRVGLNRLEKSKKSLSQLIKLVESAQTKNRKRFIKSHPEVDWPEA